MLTTVGVHLILAVTQNAACHPIVASVERTVSLAVQPVGSRPPAGEWRVTVKNGGVSAIFFVRALEFVPKAETRPEVLLEMWVRSSTGELLGSSAQVLGEKQAVPYEVPLGKLECPDVASIRVL